jgi:uncharacterized damage-inducible protein DinB
METSELLVEAFERIRETAAAALDGLTDDQLTFRPAADANSIAWLIWHLARVQDDHVAEVAGTEQVWTAAGWHQRLGLPFEADAIGYGHSSQEVAEVRGCSAEDLAGYLDAVHQQTISFVRGLGPADLERVVDRRWDPPVTLGVRLVSVISDDLQHAGQAAYVRGMLPA